MANEPMDTNEERAGRVEARNEAAGQGLAGGDGAEGPAVTAAEGAAVEPVPLHIGIDVGSTTVKLAILDAANDVKFSVYRRHHADVRATIVEVLSEAAADFGDKRMTIAITGSGGLLLAQWLGIEFVQEVIASKTAVETFIPAHRRGHRAGRRGREDHLLRPGHRTAHERHVRRRHGRVHRPDGRALEHRRRRPERAGAGRAPPLYPIASRCGVFAKTDVQPLINEGARKEDIAASIFQSVVTQTISGLACGRPIRGHVAFLGGPLQYLPELRKRFYETLELDDEHIVVPDNAHLFVASGCAIAGAASETTRAELLGDVLDRLKSLGDIQGSEVVRLPPLFASDERVRPVQSSPRRRMRASRQPHGLRGHGLPWASTPAPPRSRRRSSARTARFCGRITPATRATCWAAPARRSRTCTTPCR